MLITSHKLSFGVPLEDVFPSEEIHPALKNLLLETYKNIVKSPYRVEDVLSRFQGTLHERLKLKDRLVFCKKFEGLKTSPGALLWVARHFIGLLPTPLMPEYTDGKKYMWLEISKECKTALTDYATRGRHNHKLIKKITDELIRLPSPNLLLVATLLGFLRMLAVLPGGEPKINKSAIFALVKYFSSSLFSRPFHPGWITKKDKQYHPFLLYTILKWPEIRKIVIKPSNNSFALSLEEIYPGYCEKLLAPGYPLYLSKRSRNNGTQTAAPLQMKPKENSTLIRIVPPSYDDFSFLRDIACQTEDIDNHQKMFPSKRTTEYEKPNELRKQVFFIRRDCCCTYSTNYETDKGLVKNKCKNTATENDDLLSSDKSDSDTDHPKTDGSKYNENLNTNCSNSKRYGWKFNANLETNRSNNSGGTNNLVLSPASEFIDSATYSYDGGYSMCNLICETENREGSYESVKTFDPIEKDGKHSLNTALKGKVTKMGWTYTPPSENKPTLPENIGATSSISYNTPQEDYKLYYDVRRSLNEELQEKFKKTKIREKYDKEIPINYQENDTNFSEDLTGSNSKLHLPEKLTESKKSLINVDKIKSKLDFFRMFNAKKVKPEKSFSCEQVRSRVKYEKMGSASSIL